MGTIELAAGSMGAVIGLVIMALVIVLLLMVFWIWGIVDCLLSRLPNEHKLLWIVLMVLFPIISTVVYLFFRKPGDISMAKKKSAKKVNARRLTRSSSNKMLAGVCGGIGEYLDVDPTIIRLVWVVLTLLSVGAGIIAYLIAWLIIPQD